MRDITIIKEQTNDLTDVISQIRTLFDPKTLPSHATEMYGLVSKLRDQVNTHFTTEKSDLFPELISHGDKAVKKLANQCNKDIDGISVQFDQYMKKWRNTNAIRNNPSGCITDTQNLCGELTRTINLERNKLYPLVDKNIFNR